MNAALLDFFRQHYAPGRVGLIGASDLIGRLIRAGQTGLTPDLRRSRWSHSFMLGPTRDDGWTDGSIYIYESDLHVSTREWQVLNGAMESRLVKWCRDDIEHACVLGLDLSADESARLLQRALHYAYDPEHLRYPVGELFGTLWAILTRHLSKRNIFDDRYAVQCATFVRMCYRDIGRDPIAPAVDLTHTSPEALFQSPAFAVRAEWYR
jgi:hypothetical protein